MHYRGPAPECSDIPSKPNFVRERVHRVLSWLWAPTERNSMALVGVLWVSFAAFLGSMPWGTPRLTAVALGVFLSAMTLGGTRLAVLFICGSGGIYEWQRYRRWIGGVWEMWAWDRGFPDRWSYAHRWIRTDDYSPEKLCYITPGGKAFRMKRERHVYGREAPEIEYTG